MKLLSLGTNIEPREYYLQNALIELEKNGIKILKNSKVYSTLAWGGVAEADFLNMAVLVEYDNDAYELLKIISKIETLLGRVREKTWGDRTIDIDIIEYDSKVYNDDLLTIPHKYTHERNFVLLPIYEIVGDIKIAGKSIKKSLDKLDDNIEIYKEKF